MPLPLGPWKGKMVKFGKKVADSLKKSADFAFPELDKIMIERIMLDCFLSSLNNSIVALSGCQKHPKTLTKASLHTLEIETVLSLMPTAANDTVTSLNNAAYETHETALPEDNLISALEIHVKALEQSPK